MTTIPIRSGKEIANCKLQFVNCNLNTAESDSQGSGFGVRGPNSVRSTKYGIRKTHPSSFILHPSPFRLPPLHGFTLIEVMLTLCLLVIISSLAWPKLEKTFSKQRLRKAADIVRTQWCKARVEAMKMGAIRVFRYEIEGNRFRLEMLATDPTALLTGTTADSASRGGTQIYLANNNSGSSQNNGNSNTTPAPGDQILPKDIFFVGSQTALDTRAAMAANSVASAGNMPAADASSAGNVSSLGAGWSEPIFFYPDGTTSSARLQMRNKEGLTIDLLLRGITGIVKVGDVIPAGGQANL
jgi:prepilin-type N-terminal cleavage/methylation domain-containing protein